MAASMSQLDNIQVASGKAMRNNLSRRIRKYERRYEVTSEEMATRLRSGCVHDTAEIIEWMQAYHVLQYLRSRTPTTGIHGITIRQSMTAD